MCKANIYKSGVFFTAGIHFMGSRVDIYRISTYMFFILFYFISFSVFPTEMSEKVNRNLENLTHTKISTSFKEKI